MGVDDGAGRGSVRTRARTICDQGDRRAGRGRGGAGRGTGKGKRPRQIWAVGDDTWGPHVGRGVRTGSRVSRGVGSRDAVAPLARGRCRALVGSWLARPTNGMRVPRGSIHLEYVHLEIRFLLYVGENRQKYNCPPVLGVRVQGKVAFIQWYNCRRSVYLSSYAADPEGHKYYR